MPKRLHEQCLQTVTLKNLVHHSPSNLATRLIGKLAPPDIHLQQGADKLLESGKNSMSSVIPDVPDLPVDVNLYLSASAKPLAWCAFFTFADGIFLLALMSSTC